MRIKNAKFINIFLSMLFINTLLNSCKNNPTEFPLEINLSSEKISNSHINLPLSFEILDTLLIVFESPFKGKFIQIINKNNFRYITSTGIIGRGPGEIVNPAVHTIDKESRIIWISDWGANKIWKYPVDSVLRNSSYKPSCYVPILPRLMPLLNLKLFTSEVFAYMGFDGLVSFIDHEGNTIDSLRISNNLEIDFWNGHTVSDVPYNFDFHPKRNKIVIVSRDYNFVAGVDLKGRKLFSIQGADIKPGSVNSDWERIATYLYLEADDSYIYCLYSGKEKGIWNQEKSKYIPQYPNEIHVFDWDGNPIANLKLDHPIFSFTIDEKKRIIGIATDLYFSLVYYDLPDELF